MRTPCVHPGIIAVYAAGSVVTALPASQTGTFTSTPIATWEGTSERGANLTVAWSLLDGAGAYAGSVPVHPCQEISGAGQTFLI